MISEERINALIDKLVAAGLLVILDELPQNNQVCSVSSESSDLP